MSVIPLWRRLLVPFSLLYGAGVAVRARLFKTGVLSRRRLNGVVISVGNLTFGGTGKTPLTIRLAARLHETEKRVGILIRGYRGEGGLSDEVAEMRNHLGQDFPIGVGADRYATGTELAKKGVDWFILDDGFQHQRLGRDVEIVLVDATEQIGGWENLLPAGRMREPASALARADFVVITRAREAPDVATRVVRHTSAPIFYAQTFLEGVVALSGGADEPAETDLRGRKCFAFCGIGNPGAFITDLVRWGFHAVGKKTFRDHHRYTPRDLVRLTTLAGAAGANAMICTEKDAVKLTGLMPSSIPVYYCKISLRVAQEAKFLAATIELAERRQSGAGK